MNPELINHPALAELRQLVAELSLISHSSAMSYERERDSSENIGGKRPPGSDRDRPRRPGKDASAKQWAEYREDYQAWLGSYQRRTPEYFVRELADCWSTWKLCRLRDEARWVVVCWRKAPPPVAGIELERGSFYWKCAIADDVRDMAKIRSVYSVGRATVYRYRAKYRGLRVRPSAA